MYLRFSLNPATCKANDAMAGLHKWKVSLSAHETIFQQIVLIGIDIDIDIDIDIYIDIDIGYILILQRRDIF